MRLSVASRDRPNPTTYVKRNRYTSKILRGPHAFFSSIPNSPTTPNPTHTPRLCHRPQGPVDNGPPVIQTFDQRNLQLYLLLLYQGVGTSPPTGVSVLRAYGRVHLAARLLSPFRPARRRSAFRRETAKGLTRFILVPYCCCYLLYPHYSCNGEEAVVLSGAAAGSAAQANAELLAAAVQWRGGTRVAFHAALARPLRSIRSSRHVARVVQGRVGDRRQAGGGGRGVRVLRPQGAQREQHWRRLRPGRRAEAAPRGRGGEGRGPAAGGGRARGLGRVGGDALRGARRGGAGGARPRTRGGAGGGRGRPPPPPTAGTGGCRSSWSRTCSTSASSRAAAPAPRRRRCARPSTRTTCPATTTSRTPSTSRIWAPASP
jgi:hypothetical protein